MIPKEDLYLLIKSLSRAEKRYFRLNASLYVGEKIYLKLFDMIDNAEEYNEEEIRNHIKVSQFAVLKNRLFQLILKCMAALYADKCPDARLQEMIIQAKFLRMKGLDLAAAKLLERCRSRAMDCERIEIALEALRMIPDFAISDEKYKALNSQGFSLISKLEKQIACKDLFRRVLHFLLEKGSVRCEEDLEECAEFLNHPLLKEISGEEDDNLLYYYHIIRASAFFLLGNYENAIFEIRSVEVIVSSKRNDTWKNREKTLFQINAMVALISNKKNYALKNKIIDDAQDPFDRVFHGILLLSYHIRKKIFRKNEEVLQQMEEILYPLLHQENRSFPVQRLLLLMTHYAFISGSHRKAVRYGDNLLFISPPTSPVHLQACQLLILIHSELDNKTLVDSLMKSFVRKISATNRYFASETLFVSCIRRCYLSPKEKSVKNIHEYKIGFEIFREQFFEKNYLDEIPLDYWMDRQLETLPK